MHSLRGAAQTIGVDGSFSVVHDFFRFLHGVPGRVSLGAHTTALHGPRINLNLIRVAAEHFTGTDVQSVDTAIQDIRDIYAQVDLGVNVDHFVIEGADAEGFRVLTKQSRVNKLMKTFRGPGDRNIDVFFVLTFEVEGSIGQSAGPDSPTDCEDKDKRGRRGVVVGINFAGTGLGAFGTFDSNIARSLLGLLTAHEVGHLLLGPDHSSDPNNLMRAGGEELTPAQGETIHGSCAVHEP